MAEGSDDGFVHLRVRSAYSLLEGAIKADKIGDMAAAAEMPAVALVVAVTVLRNRDRGRRCR